ncbi:unnamed protein product [Moneuplotes crassus]|uniref:RING-type domain-containing protein n=1 Tax=Euplotes crassus TaxID=5936 RepID=A0AAD1XMN9_EUPCR|nr:unnamed protein product [Moneuplotes crassus]
MFKSFKACCGKSKVKKSIRRKNKDDTNQSVSLLNETFDYKKKERVNCTVCFEDVDYYQHKFILRQCDKATGHVKEELKGELNDKEMIAVIYQKNKKATTQDERNRKLCPQNKFKKNEKLRLYGIKQKELEEKNEEVLDCMEADGIAILTECKHVFHNICINSWLKQNNTCPICRKQIYPRDADGGLGQALIGILILNALLRDSESNGPSSRRSRHSRRSQSSSDTSRSSLPFPLPISPDSMRSIHLPSDP